MLQLRFPQYVTGICIMLLSFSETMGAVEEGGEIQTLSDRANSLYDGSVDIDLTDLQYGR